MIVQGLEVLAWAQEQTGQIYPEAGAFGVVKDDRLSAAVIFNDWNGSDIKIHIVTDQQKKWCSKRLINVTFDYLFKQLGARRVTAPIAETNTKARDLAQRLGFTFEHLLIHGCLEGNLIYYVMRPDNCRWGLQ